MDFQNTDTKNRTFFYMCFFWKKNLKCPLIEQISLCGCGKGAHPGWFDNNFAMDMAGNPPRDGFLYSHSLFSPQEVNMRQYINSQMYFTDVLPAPTSSDAAMPVSCWFARIFWRTPWLCNRPCLWLLSLSHSLQTGAGGTCTLLHGAFAKFGVGIEAKAQGWNF